MSLGGSVTPHCKPTRKQVGMPHCWFAKKSAPDKELQTVFLSSLHRKQGSFKKCGIRTASLDKINIIFRSVKISHINRQFLITACRIDLLCFVSPEANRSRPGKPMESILLPQAAGPCGPHHADWVRPHPYQRTWCFGVLGDSGDHGFGKERQQRGPWLFLFRSP